jgi:hypothetical protein
VRISQEKQVYWMKLMKEWLAATNA